MPVRNEARILPTTLNCLNQFCDQIIISDHASTDATREIVKSFKKVTLIHNTTEIGCGDQGRPAMFDVARQFDGNNLILCLDADEIAPPKIFQNIKAVVGERYKPGASFMLRWVQLWRSLNFYRDDESVWSKNYHPMMFYDDRSHNNWGDRKFFHGGRLPNIIDSSRVIKLESFPVLHLQWAYWERTQFKQAHYRMLEFVRASFKGAQAINATYAITLGDENERLSQVPEKWIEGITFPQDLMSLHPCWHYDDILLLFEKYGIACFEPLQIWHLTELRERFIAICGHIPQADVHVAADISYNAFLRRIAKRVLPSTLIDWLRTTVKK
jgi:glycosyltransferase involved in cell wall biosynthesis